MRLATFSKNHKKCLGVVTGEEIVDLTAHADFPDEMTELFSLGDAGLENIEKLLSSGNADSYLLSNVTLDSPVTRPPKFIGIGLNYVDHIQEIGVETPDAPLIFNKQSCCITGTGTPIYMPRISNKLDYEAELGFVIAKNCRYVKAANAARVIAGYVIVNDVTLRDLQSKSPTWTIGKSFDTHGPVGPWIVTEDEIGDPHNLAIKTLVNNEKRQDFNSKNLLFNCYQLVEYLSTFMELEAGDIIATGTGSGSGFRMSPRGYLKEGDVVRMEIEKIGVLENHVVLEPHPNVERIA